MSCWELSPARKKNSTITMRAKEVATASSAGASDTEANSSSSRR